MGNKEKNLQQRLDKPGSYEFFVKVSNSGGSAITTVHVVAEMEMTDKEKDDLTNNLKKTGSSIAMTALSEEHAQNSDWAWKIAASPTGTMSSSGATASRARIEFGRNMVSEKYQNGE